MIDKMTVAIRPTDRVGYAIPCEKTHTKKYRDALEKITNWGNGSKTTAEVIDIDNTPQKGFTLGSTFLRCSYFGSGNVIYRIKDPRGFELEIYQESFASIIRDVTVIKGEIQEECYWSKSGSQWVLIPIGTEVDAQHTREKKNYDIAVVPKEVLKTLPIGTKVRLRKKTTMYDAYFFGFHKVLAQNIVETRTHKWRIGTVRVKNCTYKEQAFFVIPDEQDKGSWAWHEVASREHVKLDNGTTVRFKTSSVDVVSVCDEMPPHPSAHLFEKLVATNYLYMNTYLHRNEYDDKKHCMQAIPQEYIDDPRKLVTKVGMREVNLVEEAQSIMSQYNIKNKASMDGQTAVRHHRVFMIDGSRKVVHMRVRGTYTGNGSCVITLGVGDEEFNVSADRAEIKRILDETQVEGVKTISTISKCGTYVLSPRTSHEIVYSTTREYNRWLGMRHPVPTETQLDIDDLEGSIKKALALTARVDCSVVKGIVCEIVGVPCTRQTLQIDGAIHQSIL